MIKCLFCESPAELVALEDVHIVRDEVCKEYRICGSAETVMMNYRPWHEYNNMQNELRSFAREREKNDIIHSEDLSKSGLVPSYDGPGNLKDWNDIRRALGLPSVSNPD